MNHYYTTSGEPRHFVEKKDGTGTRPTNISDCRKQNLLPSVTTILRLLDKPGLVIWKIRNAVVAALTTPRRDGEDLDAFMDRVLAVDSEDEALRARDTGLEVHDAISAALTGKPYPERYAPWCHLVRDALVEEFGDIVASETVLIGNGYAGRADLVMSDGKTEWVIDFKVTKSPPKNGMAWLEHRLQLAAYAATIGTEKVGAACVYISPTEPVSIKIYDQNDWVTTYHNGFVPLLKYWQWVNSYIPNQHENKNLQPGILCS